jgi:hypothetical protein
VIKVTCSEFIFRLPTGEEIERAGDISDFASAMKKIPIESLEYHHGNKHFSPWLLEHHYSKLVKKIEKEAATGEKLRKNLIKAVKKAE